jgi:hypothetical protein
VGVPHPLKTREGQTYADGRPFDRLQYLQAKLLLKPNSVSSAQQPAERPCDRPS